MTDTKWLTLEDIHCIHETSIGQAGGAHGIRDQGLMESALARPLNQHAYGQDDIFLLAASYAEGISRNHPFVDGNKRTAFAAADLFLLDNGYDLQSSKADEHADMIETLAQGKVTKDDAGQHFKAKAKPSR
jgi:death on curing protein